MDNINRLKDNLSWEVFLSLAVAFIVVFAVTPLAQNLAIRIGAVDIPKDKRRVHKKPIPRLGGIAIFYGFLISFLCFAEISESHILGILIGSLIIVTLGIFDDIKSAHPIIKFFVQVIAAVVVVSFDVRINFMSSIPFIGNIPFIKELPFFPNAPIRISLELSYLITVLWIVGITNAVNLIDGLDGLAVGVSGIASMSILFLALFFSDSNIVMINIAIIAAALVGACLGFLPYNFSPAKTFMGDTGAMFLGFVLACLSVQGLFKVYTVISFVIPLLILGLPIFDTSFAILRRIKNKKPIMQADRGHLHHRLLDMGLTQKQTVLVLYTISAILALSAIIFTLNGSIRAVVLLLSVIVLVGISLKFSNTPKFKEKAANIQKKYLDEKQDISLATTKETPNKHHSKHTK